jgi:DNA-binding IclR family transcriptional regulator
MPRVVPAVIRALDILELFLDRPRLSAREIAERLGLPRTTVHEMLVTLVARSYLISVPGQPVQFRLGMPVFQLGAAFAAQLDLVREAQDVAQDVAAACDEAVHVAVLNGADVIYLVKVDSTHPVRMVSAVGRRLPAHCTAVGKMLLSSLDPTDLDARLPGGDLPGMTPDSITDPDRRRAELDRVRAATLRLTALAGIGGLPALTFPALTYPSALGPAPVGVCLVGPRGSDLSLVRHARSLGGPS